MIYIRLLCAWMAVVGGLINGETVADQSDEKLFSSIGLSPEIKLSIAEDTKPILIGVVDDGFDPTHPSLNGFHYRASGEIANNYLDDDDNGFVDDISGYDVSDNDADVTPLADRRVRFYHGTFSASVIARLIKAKLGDRSQYPVRFIYIKAVSDLSESMLLDAAYDGIQYALDQGADIVSNSWSGGISSVSDTKALSNAIRADVFVANSVGNFRSVEPVLPASHPAVFGVGGSDFQGVMGPQANIGNEIDVLAPAEPITGASLVSEDGFQIGAGVSVAVPMVAATAALMKLVNPDISSLQIAGCIRNTARAVEHRNPMIAGKIGAGMLQVDAAIECARDPAENFSASVKANSRGLLELNHAQLANFRADDHEWLLQPAGVYQGIELSNSVSGEDSRSVNIRVLDAEAIDSAAPEILWEGTLDKLPDRLFLPKSAIRIRLSGIKDKQITFLSQYSVRSIDFEKRYCAGRVVLTNSTTLFDGSGRALYANRSDCQWLLKRKPGQDIRIGFNSFGLEKNDSILIFAGDQPLQRNLLTTLQGGTTSKPIVVVDSDVLVWFLSDHTGRDQGFELDIRWISADARP